MANDSQFESELAVLFDLFLSGKLDDEQERRFVELHETRPELFKEAYRTLSVDFFLRQAVCMDSRSPASPKKRRADLTTTGPIRTDFNWAERTSTQTSCSSRKSDVSGADLDGNLDADPTFNSPNHSQPKSRSGGQKSSAKFLWSGWVSAILLLLAFGVGMYFELVPPAEADMDPDAFHAVGRIVDIVDAEWEPGTKTFKTGQEIEPGFLKLRSGFVELEFASGAKAILEGPTDLLVKGRNKAFCPQGKLSVTVPPQAAGFEVATPFVTVVDRGTAFSLHVSEQLSDVHVVDGKVELLTSVREKKQIAEGFSASIDLKGLVKTGSARWETFFSALQWRERSAEYQARCRQVWESQFQHLASDSSLRYRLVPEDATAPATTKGQLHDNKALRFQTRRDRLPIILGDEHEKATRHESVTLIASVRLESMSNHANTMLIGDGFGRSGGEFLWQINSFGMLQFHLDNGRQQTRSFDSPPVFQRSDCKTWVLLGLVADAKNRKIVHYFEGRPVAVIPWPEPTPLRLDRMTLGNERSSAGKRNVRFFNGSIENFWIFSRPFSDGEMERLDTNCRQALTVL